MGSGLQKRLTCMERTASFRAFLDVDCSLLSMETGLSRRHDRGMTKLTNRQTEQTARRRSRGFGWELLYWILVAASFNAVALGAVALTSGLAAPAQAVVGVSVFVVLVLAFFAVARSLRFFE